jgi:hypothetical protein
VENTKTKDKKKNIANLSIQIHKKTIFGHFRLQKFTAKIQINHLKLPKGHHYLNEAFKEKLK